MRRSILTGFAVVLLMASAVRAQDARRQLSDVPDAYRIEALIAYWRPGADIIVSSDAPGVAGTRIDLRRDLGLADRGFPELQLIWRPALRHKFRFQYIPIHFDSTAAPSRDLVFNGVTYHAGLPVTSSLDWTTYRFGYEYDFIVKPKASVGFITEVKHTVVRAELQTASADQVSRQAMPVPAVGAIMRVSPSAHVSLAGEVTFFGVPDRADRHFGGHIADVDVSAIWHVTRHLGAQAGFRDIDINHLGEWNTATLNLTGPYVGALVRF
jgi:hypothetical protein